MIRPCPRYHSLKFASLEKIRKTPQKVGRLASLKRENVDDAWGGDWDDRARGSAVWDLIMNTGSSNMDKPGNLPPPGPAKL